ncbi:MAG: alpha/beta fold hydrolase [Acidobacteriia bacterium]|nr:alpha/beta fold hydrolase [Terriglobia bacterium]
MNRLLLMGLMAATFVPVAYGQDRSTPAQLLEYEVKQPLDIQTVATYDRPACTVTDLSYASPRGGRVGAYLVVPKAPGKFAAVLFGHWGNGTRAEFLPEAELYAQVGVVSLLPDYPWDRPESSHRGINNLQHPEQDLQTYAQTVVDLRRGLDLLLARPEVDATRIAYVGHSYGAQWGAILAAVDHRIQTAVLMGGTPTGADLLNGDSPEVAEYRKTVPPAVWNKYIEANSPLDAINFIGRAAPISVFFQFATFEQYFSRSAMERYARAASQPNTVRWYDTAHDLNDVQALLDRADWLQQRIRIASTRPLLVAMVTK